MLSLTFKNISIVDYETKVTLFYERKKKVYCTFRCILDDQFLALLSNGLVTFHIISTHKIAFHIISTSFIWTRIIFQLILFQPIIFLKNFKIKKKKIEFFKKIPQNTYNRPQNNNSIKVPNHEMNLPYYLSIFTIL